MAVAQLAVKQEAQSPPPPSLPPSFTPGTTGTTPPGTTPRDPLGLEERILTLCAQNSKGITDDIIVQDQPTIDVEKRMRALQRLLSQVCGWAFIGIHGVLLLELVEGAWGIYTSHHFPISCVPHLSILPSCSISSSYLTFSLLSLSPPLPPRRVR